jgi:hypothetical protein
MTKGYERVHVPWIFQFVSYEWPNELQRQQSNAEIGAAGRASQDFSRVFEWTQKFEFRQTESGSWTKH